MNFFIFSKIGPKNSKFGILNSQIQQNDKQIHQTRSQTLSITTVPCDSSNSGKFSIKTSFLVALRKTDIEMNTKFSTIRPSSSSSRGHKCDLPWSHSPIPTMQDSNKNSSKVVKRTEGQGLALASFQIGTDDYLGVETSRKSSGDSNKTTK